MFMRPVLLYSRFRDSDGLSWVFPSCCLCLMVDIIPVWSKIKISVKDADAQDIYKIIIGTFVQFLRGTSDSILVVKVSHRWRDPSNTWYCPVTARTILICMPLYCCHVLTMMIQCRVLLSRPQSVEHSLAIKLLYLLPLWSISADN